MNEGDQAARLVVFTKPPTAGRVKTRLAPGVGLEGAAELHRAFLADTLASAALVEAELVVAWALGSGEVCPPGWPGRSRDQGSGDLGARLARVMEEEGRGGGPVAVIGSDHPDFDPSAVEAAFDALRRGADVVLGPSRDGGYWLVGCRPGLPLDRLFAETPWSTEVVLATTAARCAGLGLTLAFAAPAEDVDTPDDLDRLVARLGELSPEQCLHTRRALAALASAVPR